MIFNEDNVRRWLEALRSDKYLQGHGYLRMKDKSNPELARYCCMGVGCDVYRHDAWIKPDHSYAYDFAVNERVSKMPPLDFWSTWIGVGPLVILPVTFTDDDEEVFTDLQRCDIIVQTEEDYMAHFLDQTLAELNDSQDWSFKDIAKFIEWLFFGRGNQFLITLEEWESKWALRD